MKTRAKRRGGGKAVLTAKNGRKHRANTRKYRANVRHINRINHKGLNIRKLMSRLKKGRKLASRTRSVKKYNRANLQSLIDFLDELDDMDEQAIKRNDNEFREKLIFFVMKVIPEIEGAINILKDMLSSPKILPSTKMEEENAADDLGDLVGAMRAIRIAPDDSDPFEIIDKAKDVLENLLEEYTSNDIQEEARAIYGDAIDMIVDAFIKAIRKHAHELKATAAASAAVPASAAAPAAVSENNLARMFSKLGF